MIVRAASAAQRAESESEIRDRRTTRKRRESASRPFRVALTSGDTPLTTRGNLIFSSVIRVVTHGHSIQNLA